MDCPEGCLKCYVDDFCEMCSGDLISVDGKCSNGCPRGFYEETYEDFGETKT